jgi:predicted secreted protein
MAEVVLDQSNAEQSLSVALGDAIVVQVDETPTSGYRWEVAEVDPTVLELEDDAFTPAAGDRVGGGGQREFRFRVVGQGESQLRLIHRRSWEPETVATDELSATITATG